MGYSILNNNGPAGKATYVADTYADLATLKETDPPMGTSCLVLENSQVYIIDSQKQWVALSGGSSGSGSGSGSGNNEGSSSNVVITGTRYISEGMPLSIDDALELPPLEIRIQGITWPRDNWPSLDNLLYSVTSIELGISPEGNSGEGGGEK